MKISRGFFWNTLGSTMYGLNSFLMLALVSRVGTVEETGAFGIAFTTSVNKFLSMVHLTLRCLQVSELGCFSMGLPFRHKKSVRLVLSIQKRVSGKTLHE